MEPSALEPGDAAERVGPPQRAAAAPVIVLAPIDAENWRQALDVLVRPDQQRFVADHQPVALVALAKAYVRPRGRDWRPYLALHDHAGIGVVALAYAEHDVGLFHLAIDHRSQNKGYGGALLKAVIDLIVRERPDCSAVHLTVHPDNVAGQALYEGSGFRPTGAMRDGEPVWQRLLGGDRAAGDSGPAGAGLAVDP